MRKAKLYLSWYRTSIAIAVIGILSWIFISNKVNEFGGSLVGTGLGAAFSLSIAEGLHKGVEHRRRKKTFGLLKLIVVPYLQNIAENVLETMKSYSDICTFEKAYEFLAMCSNLDTLGSSLDKSWLSLIYSQEFLDTFSLKKSDNHFAKIANSIKEVLYVNNQFVTQSINSKVNIMSNLSNLTENKKSEFISRAQKIRDDLLESTQYLQKHTDKLDAEIMNFLYKNGTHYYEEDR